MFNWTGTRVWSNTGTRGCRVPTWKNWSTDRVIRDARVAIVRVNQGSSISFTLIDRCRVTRGINRINRRMLIWQFFLHTFRVEKLVPEGFVSFETNSRRAYQIGKHSGCCREWKIWGKAYVHSCINFSIILPGENIIRWIETTLLSFVSFFPQSLRG